MRTGPRARARMHPSPARRVAAALLGTAARRVAAALLGTAARRVAAALLGTAALLTAVTGCAGTAPGTVPAGSGTGGPTPAGTGGPAGSPAGPGPAGSPPRPAHVVVVVLENHAYGQVIGAAPYLTGLARRGAELTASYAVAHPSQPNYLALFSGSTQHVGDDSCPHTFATPSLGGQLLSAGYTFAGYSEGLPRPGYPGCAAGRYARKHNPWVNFRDVPASANLPLSALPAAYDTLPTVAFVVPDLCHDMHDCTVGSGDAWLREHIDGYARWAQEHDSLLVVTFDEDDRSAANRIPTVLVGPMVRTGRYDQRVDHYSVLRAIEDMYRLPCLGAACSAAPLPGL